MLQKTRLADVALIGVTLLLAGRSPAFAASFDFETTPLGFYAGSLSVADGALTLVITPEGFPAGFVEVGQPSIDLMGARSVLGNLIGVVQVNRYAPLRFTFSMPIRAITFRFGDSGGDDDSPFLIRAFDAGNVLLATATGPYPADLHVGLTESLITPAGASYFIVESNSAFNAHSLAWEIESVTPVPEPTTLTSLGTGLLAAWLVRRSKK